MSRQEDHTTNGFYGWKYITDEEFEIYKKKPPQGWQLVPEEPELQIPEGTEAKNMLLVFSYYTHYPNRTDNPMTKGPLPQFFDLEPIDQPARYEIQNSRTPEQMVAERGRKKKAPAFYGSGFAHSTAQIAANMLTKQAYEKHEKQQQIQQPKQAGGESSSAYRNYQEE